MRRLIHILWVAVLTAPAFAVLPMTTATAGDLCTGHHVGARCQLGHGRRTQGGGSKVSIIGWPRVTGILWIVREGTQGQADNGTWLNDELLGSHGNDRINGSTGHDILWGDYLPWGNNAWQHDVIAGG